MKLKENLMRRDETGGTLVIDFNGTEHRVHWAEGESELVVTTWHDTPSDWECVGAIYPDGTAVPESLNALRTLVEDAGGDERTMTEDEEHNWAEAMLPHE